MDVFGFVRFIKLSRIQSRRNPTGKNKTKLKTDN